MLKKSHWHKSSYSSGSVFEATKVLVVDDDPSVRRSLARALTMENFQVYAAANRQEALHRFGDNPVDVVLLDLNLGPENGLDIFQDLRRIQPLLPVIIMTAHSDRVAELGSHDIETVMEKPLDLPRLFGTISQAAADRRRGASETSD